MKSWKKPTPELVDRARALLLHQEHVRYFFDKLDNPEWIEPLEKRDFFASPPSEIRVPGENVVRFPPWPASKYLARMASLAPEDVLRVTLKIPDTENFTVRADILEIGARLPSRHSSQLVARILSWLSGDGEIEALVEDRLEGLVVHLITSGEIGAAVRLLKAALAVRPDQHGPRTPPRTRFSIWTYDRLVKRTLDALLVADASQALDFFLPLLRSAVRCSLSKEERRTNRDLSWIWHTSLEDPAEHVDDARDVLIGAVLLSALEAAGRGREALLGVIAQLERERLPIYRRIALIALRKYHDFATDAVLDWLQRQELMDAYDFRREFAQLLGHAFPTLAKDAKAMILDRMERGPDLTEFAKSYEPPPEGPSLAERIQQRTELWQLRHLAPIADSLPSEWRERYDALLVKHGEQDDPRDFEPIRVLVGRQSPFSLDELGTLDIDALVAKLQAWVPPDRFSGLSPQGVGGQLTNVVASEPQRFTATEALRSLEPTSLLRGSEASLMRLKKITMRNVTSAGGGAGAALLDSSTRPCNGVLSPWISVRTCGPCLVRFSTMQTQSKRMRRSACSTT